MIRCANWLLSATFLVQIPAKAFSRLFPLGGKCPDLFGMLVSQIMHLGTIGFEVVQFPRTTMVVGFAFCRYFLIAHAQGSVAGMEPPQTLVPGGAIGAEGLHQANAGRHGYRKTAVGLFWPRAPSEFQDGWRDIDEMTDIGT